ncbi:hypothetical protein GW17_00053442 [Ensete ventricosum]|nr:hypothetical protein GW17_00053442 [Ensete ventricosum]
MGTASLRRCCLFSSPISPFFAARFRRQLPVPDFSSLILASKRLKSPSFSRTISSSPRSSSPQSVFCGVANGRTPIPAETKPSPDLYLFNTMTKEKELFRPRVPGRVGMYVCGVTTYDLSHIGHARVYVTFDILYR